MKNLKLLLLGVAGLLLTVNNAQAQVQWNSTVNTGLWASAIGQSTNATGGYSFASGKLTTASGFFSTALGLSCEALGSSSFAVGQSCYARSIASFAAGMSAEVGAAASNGVAIGYVVTANANRSMVIGTGFIPKLSAPIPLVNNLGSSLMIGFGSDIPSLFVGPANGLGTTGRVGIGTTNTPTTIGGVNISTYRLFVKGGILTEEVRVRTGWADYVFADNYQLLTLYEVSDFIEENGHLPNVPSATQVEEEGLELGDITRIQQEKIEELTLYLIEMQKEIDALKARLDASEE